MDGVPFGRYLLVDLLGRGGMGEVWRAYDTDTRRIVAIKLLPAALAHDPTFEQRFRREARTAAGLNDPHIIPIHHFGEIEGRLYVDMRFVDGHDLLVEIRYGALHPDRATTIIEQTSGALDTAHSAGLVHRDVKPSNIVVDRSDFCYLIDFGIARSAADTALTITGATLGTWTYMAPERFSTGQIDARADVYSLACVLFECLTGSPPYPGSTFERVAAAHLFDPVPQPSATSAHLSAFDAVIARGMAKSPEDRFSSAGDLAAAARDAARSAPVAVTESAVSPPLVDATMPASLFASAPTQRGSERPPPPAQAARHDDVDTPARKSRGQAATRWGALVGAIFMLVFVTVVVVNASGSESADQSGSPSSTVTARPTPTATTIPNSGPFTGNYSVRLAAATSLTGKPWENSLKPPDEIWDVRSACGTSGCTAAGFRRNSGISSDVMVFDHIDGQWVAVNTRTTTCGGLQNEQFEVFVLAPGADGTMVGNLFVLSSNGCAEKYAVTFRRTYDVDMANMPDPSRFPARVVSPALGLWGRYHYTIAFANGYVSEDDYAVTTYCLRTGTRCMSLFYDESTLVALVFEDEKWTDNEEYEGTCSKGGAAHIKRTSESPLPQPPQNPITLLVGHGHETISGGTCTGGEYEIRFERTGD